jgi:hypothetical protein
MIRTALGKSTRDFRRALVPAMAALVVANCGFAAPAAQTVVTAAERALGPVIPPSPKRLPDGKPNWTGFWAPVGGLLDINIGLGGIPAKSDAPAGSEALRKPPFTNHSALKSPYKEQLDQHNVDEVAGKVADPVALCFPPGMPRMMVMVYGMEVLQTPGQVTMTSEWQDASRRVWLNQSSHPPANELDSTYAGHSIGHWEGDTLVVDTVGIREDVPVNFVGLPHSARMHIVERFTSKTPGVLTDEIKIDDPDVFVAPWVQVQTYRYRPDLHLEEYVCLENNRNVGPQGEAFFPK